MCKQESDNPCQSHGYAVKPWVLLGKGFDSDAIGFGASTRPFPRNLRCYSIMVRYRTQTDHLCAGYSCGGNAEVQQSSLRPRSNSYSCGEIIAALILSAGKGGEYTELITLGLTGGYHPKSLPAQGSTSLTHLPLEIQLERSSCFVVGSAGVCQIPLLVSSRTTLQLFLFFLEVF
ncbi:hypothetical protein BC834DRAFT_55398 [Gloeopeniophorella convolvens]|nr:hypothetical protein BC834DRAFT_55398 [Gloeopeniophorella convolvens]